MILEEYRNSNPKSKYEGTWEYRRRTYNEWREMRLEQIDISILNLEGNNSDDPIIPILRDICEVLKEKA